MSTVCQKQQTPTAPIYPSHTQIYERRQQSLHTEIYVESRKIFLEDCLVFEPTNKVYVDDVYACTINKGTNISKKNDSL